MTTKDSILALAAKISNDTVPNVTTDAQALGELAKAMCGSAPTEPIATVDDAIAYITANYSGGGGVDVGPLVAVLVNLDEPTVSGDAMGAVEGLLTVAIGDTAIGSGIIAGVEGGGTLFGSFASGMTAQTNSYTGDELSAYACTIGQDGEGSDVFLTVAPYALEATRTSDAGGYSWTFVIPEMNEGVALVLYPHTAD